jgi:tetratricopeptide (TPR) repeat protein
MGWGIRIMPLLFRILLTLTIAVTASSCSTQRNTALTRSYHQITSRYNTFFNGRESFRSGVRRSEEQFRYDFNRILPVFLYTDPDIANSVAPEMDRAISKASKIIANKSITARPRERGGIGRDGDFHRQSEYNKWVRESYLLAGKAHFYKHDFVPAAQAFLFIIREYSMNDIRHEGKIWLARTHCERGRFHEAGMLLEDILADPDFPVALNVELYSTIGDYHLKQEEMEQAAVYLEKALEAAGNNDRKIRYTYILAQLYERTGNFPRASEYFSRVIRMNPPYEMVFNARVSLAGVIKSDRNETARMINDLERMLKDDKNRDYHDQIYYALGNTHLRNNDGDNAIKYFTMSSGARGSNPSQKASTYLALAGIYFNYADYLTAQSYYDSVVMNLNPGFPDRESIIEKSTILNELADNIRLYELEDSVQRLAALTETERNRKVDDIIALERKNEAEAIQRQQQAQQTSQFMSARVSQAARRQAERSGGNWYFYNQSALAFGQNEFEALWGERSLEDNWRRSNRQVVSSDQFVEMNEEEQFPASVAGEPADTKSRDYYMRNIPLTPEDMIASHQRLAGSLFNMGIIYKDDLKDFERSAEAHREFIRRYPQAELIPAAYYNLHSVSVINNNTGEADHYKNIIVSRYPDSPYAAILTNPDYFLEYEKKIQEAESHYEETFEMYKAKRFDRVREMADYGMNTWPESLLVPRFEYLKTLTYGPDNNIPLFRKMLSDYITRYPGTEMAEDAHRFLSYIENDYPELIQLAEIPTINSIYEPPREGAHHFVVIINNRQDFINRMIFNLVNFNVDNFAIHDLNISNEQFSSNYHLIRVNGLPDIAVALDYFNRFLVSEEVFTEAGGDDFHAFVMSPENFSLFMQDKNIRSYLKYFEEEYLSRNKHSAETER